MNFRGLEIRVTATKSISILFSSVHVVAILLISVSGHFENYCTGNIVFVRLALKCRSNNRFSKQKQKHNFYRVPNQM